MSILDEYPEFLEPSYLDNYDFKDCWTRTHPNDAYETRDLIAGLLTERGNYSKIAQRLGRSRRSVENHIQRDMGLRDLREDIRNTLLDDIEEGYLDDALAGDSQARRFFLQTLAKDRGYVVRNESTGKEGGPIHLQSRIDASSLSDAALLEIMGTAKKED